MITLSIADVSGPSDVSQVTDLPIAVDLDGTLVKSDTLHEGLIGCVCAQPTGWLQLHGALKRGKAAFKREVASRIKFDASFLPYNDDVIAYLRQAKSAGRRIGLFTAADQSIADSIAAHLGLFDVVRGSNGRNNLSGAAKAQAIREEFGERFSYAGNGEADHPIFAQAERVVLVGPVERLKPSLRNTEILEASFPVSRAGVHGWVRALRLTHWAKNALVFVAPILGFGISDPLIAAQAVLLFVLMGMVASSTYLINDIMDLNADRQHPHKRARPIASGAISVRDGCLVALGLLITAFLVSLLLPWPTMALLAAYVAITLAYSAYLKKQPIIDVFVLAGLFTLRVIAGGSIMTVPASPWLLTFSMLFFLGLAMVKRYAELDRVLRTGGTGVDSRGYLARDLPFLLSSGVASGFGAIIIFTTYLINEQYPLDVYANPGLLWGMMPIILIWTLRVWHLSIHGRMDEDPVVFALKDRTSLALGATAALILSAAW